MVHGNATWSRAVLDGVDVETFLVCRDEGEGRQLMLALMNSMGFQDVDIVFIEHRGPGARVRGRAYLHRPGESHPFGEAPQRPGEGRA
ncbi:hypothetical protein caldi_01260 [Caldinitratiruptor microaerophilus]|uniref:Uncharacterized protein n=1 Tax=Caldinitratiruptor microaerophilus TaxID=671077 RepID=A0AA35CKK3_9FIRM|nr:hypothetical protein caldi_01260 [Caldinitratiruptor microaerophilus]